MPSAEDMRLEARGSGVSGSSPAGFGEVARKPNIFMHFKSNFEHFEARFFETKIINLVTSIMRVLNVAGL